MTTLALIGVGRWGKNIVTTLEKIPEANLKYLCANNTEHLASYPVKYNKSVNWRELSKEKGVEAILIATPASTHFEIITYFLKNGLAVFTEKPMVLNLSEAKNLKTLVSETNGIFMVGYQYVFNDYIRFIKKEIETGSFGKILSVKSDQILMPERNDIDVFWDAGPHPLSVFQYLFNPTELTFVEGKIARNSASVKTLFGSAPELEIIASSFGEKKIRQLTITGEKATAVLDETLQTKKLAITRNGRTAHPEIDAKEPLKNEMEHFLDCLRTGNVPVTNVDFGCQITEWLEIISEKLK